MIPEALISAATSTSSASNAGLSPDLSLRSGRVGTTDSPNFGDLFQSTLGQVDALEQQAQTAIEGLMRGTGIDVHQALIAAEKANAAFEFALAIRNKAVQSYQSVMSMQF